MLGAVALDLCLVAAGVLDGYVDCVDPSAHGGWDYLASMLICREAGAAVVAAHNRDPGWPGHYARPPPRAVGETGMFARSFPPRCSSSRAVLPFDSPLPGGGCLLDRCVSSTSSRSIAGSFSPWG